MADLPPNHHADYRQFGGAFGYVAGLTMIAGRGRDADLVAELATLDATHRIVDVGCGPGTAVRRAARTAAYVIGVDPAVPMLRLARILTRLRPPPGQVSWQLGGAEALPVADASTDVCWSIASVHHWPDLDAGLAEVRRILRPGGVFIAVEKRTTDDAAGLASHGWTRQQAETCARMLGDVGFVSTDAADHDLGRRHVVAVTATAPG